MTIITSSVLLAVTLLTSLLTFTTATKGVLKLDSVTFDRIIDGHHPVFVKFDKEYSYGDDEDQWKEFAELVEDKKTNALLAEMGASEYGEKEGMDVHERFGISTEDWPVFKFFPEGMSSSGAPLDYTGGKTASEFAMFMTKHTSLYLGLPGTLEAFDKLVEKFMTGSKADVSAEAEKVASTLTGDSDVEYAKIYVKMMGKIVKQGEGYIQTEEERVNRLIDDRGVLEEKKEFFRKRLNILASFKNSQVKSDVVKEEV